MSLAFGHGAYDWLLDNVWVRRLAAVVLVWVVVFVVTRVSGRFFDLVDRRLTEFGEPARRLSKLDSLFNLFVVGLGVLVSLYALGLGSALWGAVAVTGVAGIVLGLAAQRVGQNILAGIVVLFDRPFAVGDCVETNGHLGTVSKVTLMSTSLVTMDGPVVQLPNSLMVDAPLRNLSAARARRVVVGIDVHERDLERVKQVLATAPERDPHLDRARPIEAFASESLDDGVRWVVRYWVSRADVLHCMTSATGYVLDALHDAGMATAVPKQVVRLVDD